MKTKPLYLEDPYLKTVDATILEVIPEQAGISRLILDQTVFYPMGGGQPTDQGFLTFPDGTRSEVYQVLLKDGEINHYIKTDLSPLAGWKVHGSIDWERRYKNMKLHSAGHIIDFAMYLLGYSPSPLHPQKGDHGKKPFILYSGSLGKNIQEKNIQENLQKKTDELVARNLKFSWSFELLEDIERDALYLQPGIPKNKPLRALRLDTVGVVADGGTIVASTQEVGNVTILAVEDNGTETLIRYQLK